MSKRITWQSLVNEAAAKLRESELQRMAASVEIYRRLFELRTPKKRTRKGKK
jgi:hypothetical protein